MRRVTPREMRGAGGFGLEEKVVFFYFFFICFLGGGLGGGGGALLWRVLSLHTSDLTVDATHLRSKLGLPLPDHILGVLLLKHVHEPHLCSARSLAPLLGGGGYQVWVCEKCFWDGRGTKRKTKC